jgi:hypothetical protein
MDITPKLRSALQQYHERKWFSDRYPDPFGEFIDFVTEEFIRDADPFIRRYIADILPARLHPELVRALQTGFQKTLTTRKLAPEFTFYYLRALEESESAVLWDEFQEWLKNERRALQEWLSLQLQTERKWIQPDPPAELKEIEAYLSSAEVDLPNSARRLPDLFRYFRFQHWDQVADWNDFEALAKAIMEICHIKNVPVLQRSNEAAVQLLFPISPPDKVRLQFGRAAGALDSGRFLFEFGKGLFYSGMSARLPFEKRICGDPALPLFWGSLFSLLLADPVATRQLVSLTAEPVSFEMNTALRFWLRYDAMLAVYRTKVDDSLKTAQDLYVSLFESAFPSIEIPHRLYLYDLHRSHEALHRFVALRRAVAALDRLRELYGTSWFTSERWARRMRDYWNEGFNLTLRETLNDLGS